ncbi:MAG: polymer-forming cytoskeletal protein [Candidatus Zixiibacteriota bacterium]|nr:MAG: polymer-forming cytoskeletal protein [candidate division Zixibacteria bacterium]
MSLSVVGKNGLFAASFFLSLSIGASFAQEAPDDYAPSDTVFQEIRLSSDGVTAVDTGGYDWYYDFTRGSFVAGIVEDADLRDQPGEPRDAAGDYMRVEDRCTEEIKVKSFVGSIIVGYDEYVDGDIIAYGRVTVKGWVKGDVTSLDNRVLVSRTGRVDGDIMASDIVVKDGGIVLGEQLPVPVLPRGPTDIDGLIIVASFTVFFVFCGFLIVTLMPRQLGNISSFLETSKIKAYFIGLFFVMVMPVVILLLAVTIVGVVLIPLVPFVYLFAILLGLVAFGEKLGRLVSGRLAGGSGSALFKSEIGILALMGLWFVTAILLSSTFAPEGFGILFLVVSICISSYPILTGVGAAVMTRFGFKTYTSWRERHKREGVGPTPAPPPIPKAPPEPSPSGFDEEPDETSTEPSS